MSKVLERAKEISKTYKELNSKVANAPGASFDELLKRARFIECAEREALELLSNIVEENEWLRSELNKYNQGILNLLPIQYIKLNTPRGRFYCLVRFEITALVDSIDIVAYTSLVDAFIETMNSSFLKIDTSKLTPIQTKFLEMYQRDPKMLVHGNRAENLPNNWAKYRESIIKRDGFKCVNCGCEEKLVVHHIHPCLFNGGHENSNLITLCSSCHKEMHHSRYNTESLLNIQVNTI